MPHSLWIGPPLAVPRERMRSSEVQGTLARYSEDTLATDEGAGAEAG
jgi:hypothetical protein